MKHQQVNVDYWAMGQAMLTYAVLTALGWLLVRLITTVFTLPRRLRAQQENVQTTLQDLQKRFPDLNITEEDILNADKELEKILKENDDENKTKENKTKEKVFPKIEEPTSEGEENTE